MAYSFLVFGAGAIGTYLGGYLAKAGHKVTFLERETDLLQLRENGIRIESDHEVTSITSPNFIQSLAQISDWKLDLAILAVKTYHLDAMLPELVKQKEKLPSLLCLQNGVGSEKKLRQVLGKDQIIPGTVTSAVDRKGKGDVVIRRTRGLALGGSHPRAEEFTEVFQGAGIDCSYFRDGESVKWSKLILNLLGNASSAILDLTAAEIFDHPDLYRMEIKGIRETLRVMKASQIDLVNLPGVPVKLLAWIINYFPIWLSQPLLSRLIGRGRGAKMPSFHIDLYSGRGKSEVGELNGAVVQAGQELSIPTPVNQLLAETMQKLTGGEIDIDAFARKPDLLIEKIP